MILEYKGYNDYLVEVYRGNELLGTFMYVTNVWYIALWLNIHPLYRKWISIKVYHRLSNTLIGQYSRDGAIPAKPKL
ncbi:MAG: hypothetical protein K0Q79_3405 [Flavipsychrobacter sp.]|jgi:hypothetical protein|nr:hypothetical protein [Flavipsychrobacter sp.]